MCHCFGNPTEMSADERADILDAHSTDELRAEYSAAELETLGLAT